MSRTSPSPDKVSGNGRISVASGKVAARQSVAGGYGAPGTSGGPRASMSGAGPPRRSVRGSHRRSSRSTTGAGDGAGSDRLQILDESGVDRTPKPLLSLKPTVLKNMPGLDETATPDSQASEFFMDRMSSAGFSRTGWFSETGSGSHTPQSEAGDGEQQDSHQRERDARDRRAAAEEAAAAEASQADGTAGAATEAEPAPEPELLSEADLEKKVAISLSETDTMFILQIPCVTVPLDHEEAKLVEAANKRYASLLTTKQAADKYVDAEAQTLEPLKKSREVQSASLTTSACSTQATCWDIADTFLALEATGAERDEDGGPGTVPGAPGLSVSQMAGAVGKGSGYHGGGMVGGSGSGHSGSGHTTNAGGMGASFMGASQYGAGPSMGYPSGMAANMSMGSGMSHAMPGVGGAGGGEGAAGMAADVAAMAAAAQADKLSQMRGLVDALVLMDHAVTQNNYLPQLLMYRNVQAPTSLFSGGMRVPKGSHGGSDDEGGSDAVSALGERSVHAGRPHSAAHSDGGRSHAESATTSRSHAASRRGAPSVAGGDSAHASPSRAASMRHGTTASTSQVAADRTTSMRESTNLERAASVRGPGGGPGYAASMAESNWPEELLQELADLGDDAPRMEHLWDWNCPLTAGRQVSCMAWNKSNTDLLAVGYGGFSFSTCAGSSSGSAGVAGAEALAGAEGQAAGAGAGGAASGTAAGAADNAPPGIPPLGAAANSAESIAAAGSQGKGLIAFWSLKNPEHPLWTFEVKSGVTALDFSVYSPNMLAVGMHDGTLAIHDIKSRQSVPTLESDMTTGKHADPIWKVRWLDHGPERDELVVTISTDGRVTQWSLTKGLEHSDLMKLKRVTRRANAAAVPLPAAAAGSSASDAAPAPPGPAAGEGQDAFISRLTSGMAFDFSSRDERIYVAGTEDGWIHKCSTSYNEQYLESYAGHMGPVYQVQFSPFRKDLFISASGDWTMRLWQEGRESALLTFQAGTAEVNDVQWCPTNSTVFGSVTSAGRLEIWDFSLSTVKPVMHSKCPAKQACVVFSPNSPVVVCGGEDGGVRVYRLFNVDREYDMLDEQLERLEDTLRANAMKAAPGTRA